MHIAVLASPNSWYLNDLRRAAAEKHCITQVGFSMISSWIGEESLRVSSGGLDLSSVDCLLVRTMPPGSLEQVVFRMDALARLEAAGVLVINPARAVETAVDKYLASTKMQAAGLRVPRTLVCQSVEEAEAGFAALGGDVVVKPLFGSEGRGIARLNDEALALRAFKLLAELRAVIYLQEFLPHEGCDLRVFVAGDRVLGMRRCNAGDWRTNVSRGATTEPFEPEGEALDMALAAAAAVGAPLAGVDLLPCRDGRLYAIEVNAVPGWKSLAKTVNIDIAALVLDYLEMIRRAGRSAGT